MNTHYPFGSISLTFLDTLRSFRDGGTLFGPVPKALWNRKMPANDNNEIPEVIDPILIQYQSKNYLVDTSYGTSKMREKDKKIAVLDSDSRLVDSLAQEGLAPEDIDVIIQTHMHDDHAGGLTELKDGQVVPVFPNATIYVNAIEWEEVRHPNKRTAGTYKKENWQAVQDQVTTWSDQHALNDAMTLHHTGGHSRGHSILSIKQGDQEILHLADLLITLAHLNPLWVPGLDDYPMDSIAGKEKWLNYGFKNHCKFIFYHDPYYAMVQFDTEGKEIIDSLKRKKEAYLPKSEEYMQSWFLQ